jgi:hypothetical protein
MNQTPSVRRTIPRNVPVPLNDLPFGEISNTRNVTTRRRTRDSNTSFTPLKI